MVLPYCEVPACWLTLGIPARGFGFLDMTERPTTSQPAVEARSTATGLFYRDTMPCRSYRLRRTQRCGVSRFVGTE